jgi:hypothetical protein
LTNDEIDPNLLRFRTEQVLGSVRQQKIQKEETPLSRAYAFRKETTLGF